MGCVSLWKSHTIFLIAAEQDFFCVLVMFCRRCYCFAYQVNDLKRKAEQRLAQIKKTFGGQLEEKLSTISRLEEENKRLQEQLESSDRDRENAMSAKAEETRKLEELVAEEQEKLRTLEERLEGAKRESKDVSSLSELKTCFRKILSVGYSPQSAVVFCMSRGFLRVYHRYHGNVSRKPLDVARHYAHAHSLTSTVVFSVIAFGRLL